MIRFIRAYPLAFVVLMGLLLFFFGANIVAFYTDWLWFGTLGYQKVFTSIYGARILLFGIFGAASFLLAYVNLVLAGRISPPAGVRPANGNQAAPSTPFFPPGNGRPVGRAMQVLSGFRRVLDVLLLIGALFFALAAGATAQGEWNNFLLFMHPQTFGTIDPQFGRDNGFFVFTLPFVRYVQGWLLVVLLLVGGGVLVVYLYQQGINSVSGRTEVAPHVRAHLSALAGLALLVKAWGYYLDRYDLMYGAGLVPGAGYTDIHARLPILNLLVGITALTAVAFFLNIWRRTIAMPVVALALWLAFAGVGVIIPGTVQRLRVRPNEAEREAPYLWRAIGATRAAYDVADIRVENFPADPVLTAQDLSHNQETLANIRLWDYEPLLETYPQQQGLRQYYTFPDVDVDRYRLSDGTYRQVLLAAREIAPDRLDARAQTWPNTHLRYTHGFGMVMSPAGRVSSEGLPEFLIRDMPPVAADPLLTVTEPRIYYGASPDIGSYVVVNTRQAEFDYPQDTATGAADHENRYEGKGGIRLGPLAKLALAARFAGWTNLMLSSDITPESRLLFGRRVQNRIKRIAPFLLLDHDPYPVIAGGRIVWVQDCYTYSEAYPYSAPTDWGDGLSPAVHLNYMRNAVKATVDAYDGSVTLYAADERDPVLRAYQSIFPGLIQPASGMPKAIREHRRYPEDLFTIQRRILADYHVTDPGVFYARTDTWQLARAQTTVEGVSNTAGSGDDDESSSAMAPYYLLLRLPGQRNEEFTLLSPFTPRNRPNMIALMAARCDEPHYGERVIYRFPASRTVYGPEQIAKRIRSDAKISPYLSLNDQKGSRVLFGSMLVVPIEKSLLYVQPLYVKAQNGAGGENDSASIPEMKQIVIAFENRIAMEPTLPAALADLFGSGSSGAVSPPAAGGGRTTGGTTTTVPALIEQAASAYDRAQAAQRAGDWAGYGRETRALGDALRRLRAQAPTPSPTVAPVPGTR